MNNKKQKNKFEKNRTKRTLLKQKNITFKKLYFVRACVIIFLFFLSSVVLYFKIVKGAEFEIKVINQQVVSATAEKPLVPNRGSILDRYKRGIATSSIVYDVILDVKLLVAQKESVQKNTTEGLNKILAVSISELEGYLENNPDNKLLTRNNFILRKEIQKSLADELKSAGLSCVFLEEVTLRNYPNNNFASQAVGFLLTDFKWGLEKQYENYLVGTNGRAVKYFSEIIDSEEKIISPIQGDTIITTIDSKMQEFAEEAVNKAGKEYNAKNVSLIAMNPKTGEILAWSQYPNFDSNFPNKIEGINNFSLEKEWNNLSEEEKTTELNKIWNDFNLASTFEPGSIYKPLVVAAALDEGVISEHDTFYCEGYKIVNGTIIRCWNRSGHGTLTLEESLAFSCNVAMMNIIEKLGGDKYYEYQQDFGFGSKTGIDLPNEVSASNLLNTLSQLQNSVYLATNSMGQGFNVTAIQITNAFASIINGGNLMKPYIVSQVIDNDNNIVENFEPEIIKKVITKENSDLLRVVLESVLESDATGRQASIQGYRIGGKTGTAQQGIRENKEYTLSFIGYLPVDNPEILATAIIHLPKVDGELEGSTSSAPMLREFLLNVIKYKGIQPSGEVNEEDNIYLGEKTFSMPNVVEEILPSATNILNDLGLNFELEGTSGYKVKTQYPLAGTEIIKGTTVYLRIEATEEEEKLLSKIPNVEGLDINYGKEILIENGLIPILVEKENPNGELNNPTTFYGLEDEENLVDNSNTENNLIIKQSPKAKILVPEGTIVKIYTK